MSKQALEIRFGPFAFAPAKRELTKSGHLVKLPNQSAQLLLMLIEQPGTVITREQMREKIWPDGTYVEFDFGLNSAINRIRRVLNDSARNPNYVETVHGSGYRFITPCHVIYAPDSPHDAVTEPPRQLPAPPHVQGALPAHPPKNRMWLYAAAVIGVILLVGLQRAGLSRVENSLASDAPTLRSSILLPQGHQPALLRISTQGDQIAYLSNLAGVPYVFRRYLNRDESVRVEGSEGATALAFSPDGEQLAIWTPDKILLVSKDGIRPLRSTKLTQVRTGTWAKSGYLYYSDQSVERPAIFRIPVTGGGVPEPVISAQHVAGGLTFPMVQQSLDSRDALLYSVNLTPRRRSLRLWSPPTQFRKAVDRLVLERAMGGRELPTGHLVYFWDNALFSAGWDPQSMSAWGTPIKVLSGVAGAGWTGGVADISDSGTLVYRPKSPEEARPIVRVDRHGEQTKLDIPSAQYEQLRVSPDERRLAVVRRDGSSQWSIWLLDLHTHAWTMCLETQAELPRLAWSPDGRSLVMSLAQGDADFANLYRIPLDPPGDPQRLVEQPNFGQFPTSWSTTANAILFHEGTHPKTNSDIFVLDMATRQVKPLVQNPGWDSDAVFSPDGKWIAYSGDPGTGRKIYVQSYPSSAPAQVAANFEGRGPVWSAKGDRLWFSGPGGFWEVPIRDGKAIGEPVRCYGQTPAFTPDVWTRTFDISASGTLYAILPDLREVPGRIEVVSNWFRELEKLAPTKR